jgi:hypothetical protein
MLKQITALRKDGIYFRNGASLPFYFIGKQIVQKAYENPIIILILFN